MKIKLQKLGILLFVTFLGMVVCYTALNFFDITLNGVFLDWFDRHFMYKYEVLNASGDMVSAHDINWGKLKSSFLIVSFFLIEAWVVTAFLTAQISARKASKKALTEAEKKIHEYMTKDADVEEIFPENYKDIATQMLAIKTNMLRNEQTLREEALRKNDLITYLAHD